MAQDALPLDPTPAPEPDLSIATHEAQFPQSGRVPSVAAQADEEHEPDDAAPPVGEAAPAPGPPRGDPPQPGAMPDPQGRLAERAKTPRHRAKSQQATSADVPRIHELTGKLRAAEQQIADLRARLTAPPLPPDRPFEEKEPKPDDFPDDPLAFARATAAYDRRKEAYDSQVTAAVTARDTAHREMATRNHQFFQQRHQEHLGRMDSYIQTNPEAARDFEQVTNADQITPVVAAAVTLLGEHSPRALHQLVRDRALRDELTVFTEGKPLTPPLVAWVQRRLLTGMQAAMTGSAAPRPPVIVPRPPNPVRTTPQIPADQPPDDRAPLSAHERAFPARRRR